MINKITIIFAFFLSSLNLFAQSSDIKLQPEDPSFFPANAVNIKKTPSYAPKNEIMNAIEQRGLVPYKGHECENASVSFEEGENGKQYGSSEFMRIHINIMQYGSQAKQMFDQLKPYDESNRQLQEFATSSKAESDNGGTRKSRNVVSKDVVNGKMILQKDVISCVESHYKEYTTIYFKSVALVGTTIITIEGTYNSDDEMLAQKIHSEIVDNIKKGLH